MADGENEDLEVPPNYNQRHVRHGQISVKTPRAGRQTFDLSCTAVSDATAVVA